MNQEEQVRALRVLERKLRRLELLIRNKRRAESRSDRNQPPKRTAPIHGAWHRSAWRRGFTVGGSDNRKRNKHGRVGVAR